MTKKKTTLVITSAMAILLVAGAGYQTLYLHSGDNKAAIEKLLSEHYKPGRCFGMPGPTNSEPRIELSKTGAGWDYEVSDGKCCDITIYTGSVLDRAIKETSKRTVQVPC